MPLIKRYPNRKLYDTESRHYITLEEIAEMVQRGEDIQVVEHASGIDLTALTLSQIIYEMQKKQPGHLPHSLLKNLIHGSAQRLSHAPVLNELVDAEIQRRIEGLVADGELDGEEGEFWLDKLLSMRETAAPIHWRPPLDITTEQITQTLQRLPILTRKDYLKLQEQLEQLEASLDQIKPKNSPAADSCGQLSPETKQIQL